MCKTCKTFSDQISFLNRMLQDTDGVFDDEDLVNIEKEKEDLEIQMIEHDMMSHYTHEEE